MRIRTNFLVVGLILFCAGPAHGDPAVTNGNWWLQQSESFKVGWVTGFAEGSFTVRMSITTDCLKQAGANLEQLKQVREKEHFEAAAADCDKKHDSYLNLYKGPDAATNGQIVEGLDHFYADNRNKNINVVGAIYYVYQELNGVPGSTLDEIVRSERQ